MHRRLSRKSTGEAALAKLFLGRYVAIYDGLYEKDRNLTMRREIWGFAFTLVSIASLYSAYAWCAVTAAHGLISIGDMTMYIMMFRQGQAAVTASLGAVGGMYEDNLYLSTLYEYLEVKVEQSTGTAVSGPDPEAGVQFENVEFRYPGSDKIAITGFASPRSAARSQRARSSYARSSPAPMFSPTLSW